MNKVITLVPFRRPSAFLTAGLLSWFLSTVPAKATGLVENVCFKCGETEHAIIYLPHAAKAPGIDGNMNENCWQDAWKGRFGVGSSNWTELAMMYDADYLYLGAKCAVNDIKKLKTVCSAGTRNTRTWNDDCIDFQISPDEGRTAYQFLVSAGGSYDNYRGSGEEWKPVWTHAARIGANEYVVEVAVPFKEIDMRPLKSGAGVLLSFGRTDRTGFSGEDLSSYGGEYGILAKAPVFILGTEAEYHARLKSGLSITTNTAIDLYLDRDQYPSFERLATGRVRIKSAGTGDIVTNVVLLLSLTKAGKEMGTESIEMAGKTFDFDMPIKDLAPGTYELNATLKAGQLIIKTQKKEFIVQETKAQKSGKVPITVPAFPGSAENWPLTFGIPFPWGALDSDENIRLINSKGVEIPIQTKVTCRWSKKGSIRWLLVDCLVPAREQEQKIILEYGPAVQQQVVPEKIKIEQTETNIVVDTGKACFMFAKHKTPGLSQVLLDNHSLLLTNQDCGVYLVDEGGKKYMGTCDPETEVVVESAGPLKACVRISGWHVAESGERLGKYILRYYLYAGLPYARVYHTFIITASSNADTGGSKEEVRYRDIAYALPFSSSFCFLGTPTIYPCMLGKSNSVYLVQRSDTSCRVYKGGKFDDECEKAEGWMSVGRPGGMLTVAMKDFWQNYPKEYEVTPQAAIIHFWPAHNEEVIHTAQNTSIRNVYLVCARRETAGLQNSQGNAGDDHAGRRNKAGMGSA
jgi:hypothetical protein